MRVRTIIAAAVFSSALALVGCSDPEPKEPNGPTKTATPTHVAPTLPEAATKDSEEGAVAFVKHYIALLNYAANTGDVEQLRDASDPACEGCASYVSAFESTYEQGGDVTGFEWTVSSASHQDDDSIATQIDLSPYQIRKTADLDWALVERAEYSVTFNLNRSATSWSVQELIRPTGVE